MAKLNSDSVMRGVAKFINFDRSERLRQPGDKNDIVSQHTSNFGLRTSHIRFGLWHLTINKRRGHNLDDKLG